MSKVFKSTDEIAVHVADLLNGTPTYEGKNAVREKANLLVHCGEHIDIRISWSYKDTDGWHQISKRQKVTILYSTPHNTFICASRHSGVTIFWEAFFSTNDADFVAMHPMMAPP